MTNWIKYNTDRYEAFDDKGNNRQKLYVTLEHEGREGDFVRLWSLRVYELERIDFERQRVNLIEEEYYATMSSAKKYAEKQYFNHGGGD